MLAGLLYLGAGVGAGAGVSTTLGRAAIARSAGITLPYSDPAAKVMDVCAATANNRSSMLQDIEAGKKTEINYLNGALVRYGKETGVAAPVNSFLTHLVKALETGSSAVH